MIYSRAFTFGRQNQILVIYIWGAGKWKVRCKGLIGFRTLIYFRLKHIHIQCFTHNWYKFFHCMYKFKSQNIMTYSSYFFTFSIMGFYFPGGKNDSKSIYNQFLAMVSYQKFILQLCVNYFVVDLIIVSRLY